LNSNRTESRSLLSFLSDSRATRREILAAGTLSALAGLAGFTEVKSEEPGASAAWADIARQFLTDSDLIPLNTGSLGTSPLPVLQAVEAAWRRLERDPVMLGYGPLLAEAEATRKSAAELVHCSVDELALTRNATDGMNLVAQGIALRDGDRILTTNQEHPGGKRCWEHFAKRGTVSIDQVELPVPPVGAGKVVELFKAAIKPRTRVISVSHVTYTNGFRLPIPEIARLAHEHDCLMVVDGAQAVGGIAVDVAALGCDAYAATGHKWLLGPKGTGFLYISRRAREQIAPMLLDDGYGVYTAITGYPNLPGIFGLGAAIEWGNRIGRARLEQRILELRNALYEKLRGVEGVTLVSVPPGDPAATPILGVRLPQTLQAPKVVESLTKEHKVVVRSIGSNGVDLRLSTHLCNSEDQLDRFVGIIRTILR
jgi:selenocysteine lyase/cysteine desulfurase